MKILEQSSSDSEIAPPIPNKVLNLKDNSVFGGKGPVPKLDLTKAKKIQEINAKKSTQQIQPAQPSLADLKALDKLKRY